MARNLPAHYGAAALAVTVALFVLAPGRAITPEQPPYCAAPEAEQALDAAAEPRFWEPQDRRRRALAEHLARRYFIALDAAESVVESAYYAAAQTRLDPLLVLAVIAIESRFNPFAESAAGAKGLMQVIPKYHQAKLRKFGGDGELLDPLTNIVVGARILDEYIGYAGGVQAGLQLYNGAPWDATRDYARKVLAEQARIAEAVRGVDPVRLAEAGS